MPITRYGTKRPRAATSHYVTEELDAGPIIEQNITQVSHLHSIQDFIAQNFHHAN